MILANGEKIIKDWDYAKQKGGAGLAGKIKKTLTVTNKRIVHEVHSNVARTHQEIPLNAVKSISMSSVRKVPTGAILAIILGIVAIAASFALPEVQPAIQFSILGVGALLFIIGVLGLGHGAFTLEIATKGLEGSSLYVGTSSLGSRKKKIKKVKMKVDLKVVDDIMDTLGAILIDNVTE